MDKNKVKLGIAPIAWTNDDLPDLGKENTFQQCISEMALAGFTGSEVGNKYPKDTKELKEALELRNLCICNAWFSACFTTKSMEEVEQEFIAHRDFLYEMGAKVIGACEVGNSIQGLDKPVFDDKPVYSETQWEVVTKGFSRLAELAKEKDMKLCCHHHMGTGVQTPEEIHRFMEMVSDDVYLLFDTGHLYYSEGNQQACIDILNKYINRIAHVHLKDVRKEILAEVHEKKMSFLQGVRAGAFTVPGDGCIDFEPIFKILDEKGYEGWFVVEAEQDPAKANAFAYALKAREYIKQKTGL